MISNSSLIPLTFINYFYFKDFCVADQCRILEFSPEKVFEGKRLIQHTIHVVEVTDPRFCKNFCYMEPDCVSINLDKRENRHGNYKCELNNVTHEGHEHRLEDHEDFFYHAAEVNTFFPIYMSLRKCFFSPWHFCFNDSLK